MDILIYTQIPDADIDQFYKGFIEVYPMYDQTDKMLHVEQTMVELLKGIVTEGLTKIAMATASDNVIIPRIE